MCLFWVSLCMCFGHSCQLVELAPTAGCTRVDLAGVDQRSLKEQNALTVRFGRLHRASLHSRLPVLFVEGSHYASYQVLEA